MHIVIVDVNHTERDLSRHQIDERLERLLDVTWPSLYMQEPRDTLRLFVLLAIQTLDCHELRRLARETDALTMRLKATENVPDCISAVVSGMVQVREQKVLPDWIVSTCMEPGDVLGVGASALLQEAAGRLSGKAVLRLQHGYEYHEPTSRLRELDEWVHGLPSLAEVRAGDDPFLLAYRRPLEDREVFSQVSLKSERPAYAVRARAEPAQGRPWETAADYVRYFGPGFAEWAV